MNRYMNVFVLYVPIYECICTIFTDVRMYLYYMYRYMDVFVLYVWIYGCICTMRTDTHSYLKFPIRLLHIFSETATICTKTPQ